MKDAGPVPKYELAFVLSLFWGCASVATFALLYVLFDRKSEASTIALMSVGYGVLRAAIASISVKFVILHLRDRVSEAIQYLGLIVLLAGIIDATVVWLFWEVWQHRIQMGILFYFATTLSFVLVPILFAAVARPAMHHLSRFQNSK